MTPAFCIVVPVLDEAHFGELQRFRRRGARVVACTADLLMFLHADTRLPHNADTLVRRATLGRTHWGRRYGYRPPPP